MLLLKQKEFLKQVAKESAKMSWPGQMQGILNEGTKHAVEEYFSGQFIPHLRKIRSTPYGMTMEKYDLWHRQRVKNFGNFLRQGNHVKISRQDNSPAKYKPDAVACILLNTFMHQLMIYEEYRRLWRNLHLVFDRGVFKKLHSLSRCYSTLISIDSILEGNPYKITYKEYVIVQNQLWKFIGELNKQPGADYKICSRIELNPILWTK